MPQIPEYIRATSMVFCIIIMCLGVIGNIMVPIVILKTKDMRNSTNIFLTNLSIADLLVLLVCTPTVLVEVNSPPEVWVLGEEMCKAVPFVELTVAHASVLTILAISFERYYAICEPLKAGYVCTKTRALLICLAAWTVAAILTSPILMISSYEYVEYIDGNMVAACLSPVDSFWPASFFVGSIVLFFIIPLFILVVLYSVIAKNLMDNPSIIMSSASSGNRGNVYKYRKQVIFMLGAVVVSFFVCLLPFRALTLWIIIVPSEAIVSVGIERFYILLYFCRIMLYMNSAINPILYNLMSSKFRNGFLQLLGCGKIVRSDSISSGARKGGGTFHTGSTNLSSSHGTSSSQRKSQREDSSNGGNSIRRPTVQFQQPPVSDEWHPSGSGALRRHSSIISIRAVPSGGKLNAAESKQLEGTLFGPVLENGNKIVEEEEAADDSVVSNVRGIIPLSQQQQPLPNSNGFHRFKDRVKFNGSRQSYRAKLDFHHYRGSYVGHGQLTDITSNSDTSEVESNDGPTPPLNDEQQQHRSNDNNRFSLLKSYATAALATATTAATATAVVVIVATGSVDLDPNTDHGNHTEPAGGNSSETEKRSPTADQQQGTNGKESPTACIASSFAVGSMECDI
ncbi:neuropeptide Y receptor type 2-like isoform X1 [Anopheles maculipalpis]|uniref:neuropeptide Y receptor type 2-like isoform X1 n=1 Tax=Anopheles maculipalpis TaxID=1496333 RepID=UPI002159A626|nr:neuropeptide Y receptor type 2-like isoform X1 [Anopheles maculipalpis]